MKDSTQSRVNRRRSTKSATRKSIQNRTRHAARKVAKTVRYN